MKKVLFTIVFFAFLTGTSAAELCFVQSVVDDGTIKLLNGERLKLIGVDVQEENSDEIAQFIRNLVSGSVVSVEYDVQKHDNEGYLNGYLWFQYEGKMEGSKLKIPDNFEARLVLDDDNQWTGIVMVLMNATLIKSGLAAPADEPQNSKYSELFSEIYDHRKSRSAETLANLE